MAAGWFGSFQQASVNEASRAPEMDPGPNSLRIPASSSALT
jgi:hypothetical protein